MPYGPGSLTKPAPTNSLQRSELVSACFSQTGVNWLMGWIPYDFRRMPFTILIEGNSWDL